MGSQQKFASAVFDGRNPLRARLAPVQRSFAQTSSKTYVRFASTRRYISHSRLEQLPELRHSRLSMTRPPLSRDSSLSPFRSFDVS